jgi:phospholipid/cholesterol/gamma-HCH transport system substrate-binding protein
MRPVTSLELKVGLLIVAGLVATVVLVLVSDRVHFERTYVVNAYLTDAGGLRLRSPVTLSGLRIGAVAGLAAVRDPRGAIRVAMTINREHSLPVDSVLTVTSNTFFGDSYLALTVPDHPSGALLPMDGTAEVVASRGFLENTSRQVEGVLGGAADLLGPDNRADLKRLLKNSADLSATGLTLAQDLTEQNRRLGEAIASMQALADDLRASAKTLTAKSEATLDGLDRLAVSLDGRAGTVGAAAQETLAKVEALIKKGEGLIDANADNLAATVANMKELSARCARIAADLQNGQGVLGQLLENRELAKDLNGAAVDIGRTATFIADHPEALIFGAEPGAAAVRKDQREREKMRRAFREGYETGPVKVSAPASAGTAPAK